MSVRWGIAVAAAIAVAVAWATGAAAYTFVVEEQRGRFVRLHWPAMPVALRLNQQTGPQLPNITDDSTPVAAIQRALERWPAVADISFVLASTAVESGGRDGDSIVSFAATDANRAVFEMAGEPTAVTLYFFQNDTLTEADILFNPNVTFTTTAHSDAELRAADLVDVEAVTVHELGHVLGLNHSGVESAAMWAFQSLGQRALDPDDVAAAQTLYPRVADSGQIRGRAVLGRRPAFGAHIVAAALAGPVRSALTLPDGTYRIESLPAGDYIVYAEPLDGPHGSFFIDGCVRFGNMGGAGIYENAELTTDFATTFYGGSDAPITVTVAPAATVLVDLDLAPGAAALNPVRIGPGTADGSFERLAEIPLDLQPGGPAWIAIGGPGLDRVTAATVSVVGGDVSIDADSGVNVSTSCGQDTLPALVFRATASSAAAAGGRTILLSAGGETATFTGALRIAAPQPVACVGDCDDSRHISIDELVRGVNIALDLTQLDACPDIDDNDSGLVSIDELLLAVNAALNGCAEF
jgi:hypothetical protein